MIVCGVDSKVMLGVTCRAFRGNEKGKGKSVPLQAWSGPDGSRKFKVPRFLDNDTGRW